MDLDVQTSQQGSKSVVALRGEIDVYTAPLLRQALVDLIEQGQVDIVIDMTSVDFLDSTGLGVLVEGLKRVRTREGDLAIVVTEDKILKIFDITGLNKSFSIRSSLDEALTAGTPQT